MIILPLHCLFRPLSPEEQARQNRELAEFVHPTVARTALGCQDLDFLKQLERYKLEGDKEAFERAAMQAVAIPDDGLAPECSLFYPGTRVYNEDSSIGYRKVRREGKTVTFWIARDAFETATGQTPGEQPSPNPTPDADREAYIDAMQGHLKSFADDNAAFGQDARTFALNERDLAVKARLLHDADLCLADIESLRTEQTAIPASFTEYDQCLRDATAPVGEAFTSFKQGLNAERWPGEKDDALIQSLKTLEQAVHSMTPCNAKLPAYK
jgi:hypothetical protein